MFFFRKSKRRNISKLDERQLLKAQLSNEVYNKPDRRQRNINSYVLDNEYNKDNFAGYVSELNKDAIFVIRGTATLGDVGIDILLIIQQMRNSRTLENSGRFNEIKRNLFNFYDKYKRLGYTIRATGHSLGGFEIIKLEQRHPEKIDSGVVFNAGSIPLQKDKIPNDITHIRNPRDLVSLGWKDDPQTIDYINNKKLSLFNPYKNHTIDYFL
jgi:hypothetical protein